MRFNSLIYPLFLLLVVVVFRRLPVRFRAPWLLATSFVFYGSWHWPYLFLLIGTAALNYLGALWIVQAADRSRRGAIVVSANLALLALFKYLDWLVTTADSAAALIGVPLYWEAPRWVLPLGISFYIFESISYIVDLMRKREQIHSFLNFQLFIAFFPKLIAGPILRAKELLPQIERPAALGGMQEIADGLVQITLGMFIKIVLADNLAPEVDRFFAASPASLSATDVYVAAVAFGLQIYFDFSGYSRIAIGSALLCGIRLVDNFNHPYVARSPVDFWNRWHMSLSRWIRDYLFYPLLRRETTQRALMRAAIVSMTLCGLWHGAGWTFIAWGLYHGLLIAAYHRLQGGKPVDEAATGPLRRALAVVVTFALVSLGWLWFRSVDLTQAWDLTVRAFQPWRYRARSISGTFYLQTALLVVGVWVAPAACRLWQRLLNPAVYSDGLSRWSVSAINGLGLGLLTALCLLYLRGQSSFIYFQF